VQREDREQNYTAQKYGWVECRTLGILLNKSGIQITAKCVSCDFEYLSDLEFYLLQTKTYISKRQITGIYFLKKYAENRNYY
jgi:hypothetical protein